MPRKGPDVISVVNSVTQNDTHDVLQITVLSVLLMQFAFAAQVACATACKSARFVVTGKSQLIMIALLYV